MAMGFNLNEKKVSKDLLINHNFTNAMFFGRTGSGKTSCGILPNIEDRIKNDYGVLVYDFKGNLHTQVKLLANKYKKLNDVIEIGKPWGKKINLCDYLNKDKLSLLIADSSLTDTYWTNSSRTLFSSVYTICKNLNFLLSEIKINPKENKDHILNNVFDNKTSYAQIYKFINSTKDLQDFYTLSLELINLLSNSPFHEKKFDIYEKKMSFEKILSDTSNLIDSLVFYNQVKTNETGGKVAVLNHLSSILVEVAHKDYLNHDEIDLIKELRDGKIVIIDVSSFNDNTLNILNLAIYNRLQKASYSFLKPVSIFIDEAQKVLNADYLPQVDVCRESKFEYIFATQDKILLENKLGKDKFEELFTNIISKYSFATNDNDITQQFEYLNLSTNRQAFAKPLFLDKKDLINVEYLFQKKNDILGYSDYSSLNNDKYILKYDEKLIEDYKILIEKFDGEIIEARYLSYPIKKKINKNEFIKKDQFYKEKRAFEQGVDEEEIVINFLNLIVD